MLGTVVARPARCRPRAKYVGIDKNTSGATYLPHVRWCGADLVSGRCIRNHSNTWLLAGEQITLSARISRRGWKNKSRTSSGRSKAASPSVTMAVQLKCRSCLSDLYRGCRLVAAIIPSGKHCLGEGIERHGDVVEHDGAARVVTGHASPDDAAFSNKTAVTCSD